MLPVDRLGDVGPVDGKQKRGLSGTWRTFCASNSSRQASSSHADAGATRACAPHVTHDAQYSDSARSGDERQSHAMQHVGISFSVFLFLVRK